jgi:hypothetical protein
MTKRRRSIITACLVATTILTLVAGWHWYRGLKLYTVTVLPSLGGCQTLAHSINDRGQVVGVEYFANNDRRLFLWDRQSGIQDLGLMTANPPTINNAGQICATMIDPNGDLQVFLWEPGKDRMMLGTLAGGHSVATTMNNRSQIVGTSHNTGGGLEGAFLWDRATGMKALRIPDRRSCWPVSIDDHGRTLAYSDDGGPTLWRLFDANGPTSLDVLPPGVSRVYMNNHGWLAGIDGSSSNQAYLFLCSRRGPLRRLFPVSGDTVMTRLNDRNQVACTSFAVNRWREWYARLFARRQTIALLGTSYLWDPQRGKIPLDRYVPNAECFLVKDLNNNGCIVGAVCTKKGQWQAVLLEPISRRWDR